MTAQTPSDIQAFHQFLTVQIGNGGCNMTPEESVAEFRRYQEDLKRFKQEIQSALGQLDQGEGREIDFDHLEQQVTERLAEEGITD